MNEEKMNEAAAHCEIGPSSLPARAVCPCYKGDGGSAVAESGTRAHKVVEAILKSRFNGGDAAIPTADGKLTPDEKARGEWGANRILALRDSCAPDARIYSEQLVAFDTTMKTSDANIGALSGLFGTIDAHWLSKDEDTIFIADFKTYARSDGDKDYSPQGKAYAAFLASHFMKTPRMAVFHVVCAGDYTVASYEFTVAEAVADTARTVSMVKAAMPGGLFKTGMVARERCAHASVWCDHCAYASDCPAISRAVETVAKNGILTKPLALRMAVIPILEAFAKKTKAEVRAELDAGRRVFDDASGIEYALAERKGKAKLSDLRGLAGAVIGYGVAPEAFASAVSVSKTAVDGLLKAADDDAGRKVKKAERESVYLPYFTEAATEKYVKRIS